MPTRRSGRRRIFLVEPLLNRCYLEERGWGGGDEDLSRSRRSKPSWSQRGGRADGGGRHVARRARKKDDEGFSLEKRNDGYDDLIRFPHGFSYLAAVSNEGKSLFAINDEVEGPRRVALFPSFLPEAPFG